jgi:hypothetical protein
VKKVEKRPRGRPALSKTRVQLTLRPEIRDALAQIAQKENMTQSECVEEALLVWIKRKTKGSSNL